MQNGGGLQNGAGRCGRLRIQMNRAYDIGVESLSGGSDATRAINSFSNSLPAVLPAAIPSGLDSQVELLHTHNSKAELLDTQDGQNIEADHSGGTFFLETFGCQMNDHDSEKVAGLLLSRGYRQVETPEAARMILYNTCSIREKAAQKVFSRLGEYRERGRRTKLLACWVAWRSRKAKKFSSARRG